MRVKENGSIGISGVSVTPATGDAEDPVTVTVSVGHGTLHAVASSGVMVGPDGATVTIFGLASDVTDDQTIGAHPQGLTNQLGRTDRARTLDVRQADPRAVR